ncbi:MAG TPA: TlpA disulfide reductase family protein [Bryobacteraceae bacterium]|jgi:peroxiredoxin
MPPSRQRKLLDTGSRAPDFRLPLLDGGEASLHDLIANGPVLLAFFKITCPVCQLTFPFLERLHQGGTLPIYGISQNGPEDTREFNQEFGVTFPILLDREDDDYVASNAFGISTVPTLFLVEPDGTISHVTEGWQKRQIEWLGGKAGMTPIRAGENVPEWKSG